MRHKDENEQSLITFGTEGSELDSDLKSYADYVIEKSTPSAFFNTILDELLQSLGVTHIFITGFNTEYCPQFTVIAAYDRGYQVTFIEDGTATVNDDSVYEFHELDIRDFVGSVVTWSTVTEVTFIRGATATVNDDSVYEFPGLDIRDFVGSVLNWSNVIEVLDFEEFVEDYAEEELKS